MLFPIRKIILNPNICKAPDTIKVKFIKENVVVKGVKGLAKVKKYSNSVQFIIKIACYLQYRSLIAIYVDILGLKPY